MSQETEKKIDWETHNAERDERAYNRDLDKVKANFKDLSREQLETRAAEIYLEFVRKSQAHHEIVLLFSSHCANYTCKANKKKT